MENFKKTSFGISIAHTTMLVCVVGSLLTGFRMATYEEPIGWLGYFTYLIPQGAVHIWHFIFAVPLIIAFAYYLLIFIVSKRYVYIIPTFSKRSQISEELLKITIFLALFLLAFLILTGALQFFGIYLGGYQRLNNTHQLLAWIMLAYLVGHVMVAFIAKGIPHVFSIFVPDFGLSKVRLVQGAVATAMLTACFYFAVPNMMQKTLPIVPVSGVINIDGEANEQSWQQSPEVWVETVNGHNLEQRQVAVSIKAQYDEDHAYFRFRWADESRSLKHLPLIKTEEGWEIMNTDVLRADESEYYEDKFAVMLSRSAEIAGAGTVHLGHKPLADHPVPIGGRGLHYTDDGSLTDVWHWKAVRTGFSIGQADDNHFGRPLPSDSEFKRYTGGYQRDDDCEHLVRWEQGDYKVKPQCGGYVANWEWLVDGVIQPRRLPTNKRLVRHVSKIEFDPAVSDRGRWWMNWQETKKYNVDKDDLPIGSVIPSVLSLGPFQRGRGDITTAATWREGYWTLEIKRRLAAGSRHDLPVEDGVYFWVAVFNRNQTRHSYHLHPLKIKMR